MDQNAYLEHNASQKPSLQLRQVVVLVYIEKAFSEQEIDDLKKRLSKNGISLITRERSFMINASLDIFAPVIEILLSPEILTSISVGILGSAIYDVLKGTIVKVFSMCKRKKISKVQPHHKITEQLPNVQLKIGSASLFFPLELEEEEFKYVVDSFFELSQNQLSDERSISFLDKDQLVTKTENQLIQEMIDKKNKEGDKSV